MNSLNEKKERREREEESRLQAVIMLVISHTCI